MIDRWDSIFVAFAAASPWRPFPTAVGEISCKHEQRTNINLFILPYRSQRWFPSLLRDNKHSTKCAPVMHTKVFLSLQWKSHFSCSCTEILSAFIQISNVGIDPNKKKRVQEAGCKQDCCEVSAARHQKARFTEPLAKKAKEKIIGWSL